MPELPRQMERRVAPDLASDPFAGSPASPPPTDRRMFARRIGDRLAQFVAALKTNALWMKKFLHGRK